MIDTTDSLLQERDMLRKELVDWWRRWRAVHADNPNGTGLIDLDTWAKETPEETEQRIRA